MMKYRNRRQSSGFTLAELLIVVAIIGVLVAISIPIFTSQLEKAREATDAANIRSQYAEVMSEAITEGGNVSGKDLFGAVELKQKKDQWQSSGLKENLEGVYQDVEGDYPKAGGTAWVEYKDDQAILHYEDGSGNAAGGSDSGGSTGGNTGGSTGSGSVSGGGSGDNSGGNSDENIDGATIAGKINNSNNILPTIDEADSVGKMTVQQGKIYTYKGKKYVALSTMNMTNHYDWITPDHNGNNNYTLIEISDDTEILTDSDLSNPWNANGEKNTLTGLHAGSLYKDSEGNIYVYKYSGSGDKNSPPVNGEYNNNWQLIDFN